MGAPFLGDCMSDGGKGDGRRKGADDNKYRNGWDRIFGDKNRGDEGDPNKGRSSEDAKGKSS